MTASYEGDLALWNLNWDQKFALWNYNLGYSDSAQAMSSPPGESWLMSAQQVYKPGETLRLKIISRIERDGVLEDFQGPEGRLVILDPAGQVFLDKNYPVSPFGSLDVEEPIPADAPYGYYSFYLDRRPDLERDARELHPYVSPDCDILGSVGVLAYRTPPFEISFPSLPENPLGGDKETIEAVARYHYGAPAAGLQSFHTVLSEPFLDFGFPAWSGYAFTDYFSFQSDAEAGAEYGERGLETVLEGSGTLDSQGKISFPLELPPDKVPIPRTYSVSVSAYDLDSRHVSAYKSFTAHPSAVYVGIKTGAYLVAAGEDSPGIEADLIVTDLKGELLTGRRVKVALKRRFWTTTRRKAAGGVYEYVSKFTDEPVSETELESADQPVKYQALPPKAGFYILSAETLDDRGLPNRAAVSFYAFGGAESGGWRYENDDSINLVSDKTEYSPGDVAKIMIQSPFSEGVGLLTTERGGVREARVFKVESQSPVVEVPISEKDFPNVYVSILLVRGRVAAAPDKNNVDLGKPSFRMGYRKLKVKSRASILLVEAQAAKKEYAPGDEVEIDVSVRDHEGNPFADLELAVAVVDAGVVQLSGDEGFYPEKLFSRERPVAVETVTNIANVIGRRDWANKGGGAPGGGGGAPGPDDGDVRRDFRSVPFYQGKVEVSADGKARVKFKLPDNTTTFKIYALATGHGALTGTGSGEFLVTKDFLLRSSLPRYATLGDRFSAGVTVANRTEKAGEARVEFSATGLKLDGDEKVKNVSVPAGGGSEVFFKVVAVGGADESQSPLAPEASPAGDDGAPKGASPSDPSAKALFQADMGNMVDKAEFGLPLREAGELIVQAAYNEVSSETLEVEILLPPEADRDPLRAERSGTGLKVDLYPSLIPLLKAPLKYLETYPYDCLEQSTSKAFAALSALKLGPRLDIDPEDGERLKRLVERHISNLVVWQLGGGFVYWPKNPDWGARSPYLTSYVLLFLKEAEAEGFRVDPDLVGYVREYLSDAYAELSRETDPRLRRDDERLFVLLALTRSGSDTASELELFFLRKDELDLYGLSLLTRTAAALAPSPNRAVFLKELVPLLANDLEISAGRASVKSALGRPEFFLYGKDDLNAQILLALVEAEPDFHLIPSLARAVTASARSEDFGNTYRAAALLSAVSRYAQLKEPEDMNVDYGAVYAGKEILKGVFKSAGDKPVSAFLKPGELSTGRAPLVFSASGKGSLWSRAELSYRLKEPDLSPLTQNGLVLSRVYQVIRPEAEKPGESVFKRGQVLRVTVTLLTHVERRNLVLEDKIPAGFEAVDFNLRDADRTLLSQVANPDSAGGYSNWYDHREDGPDKVALFADYLPPGVYEYSYLARPVTPGTFLVEGPAAHEMYAPENRGRGAGLTVTVEEPQSAAAKDPGTENEAEAGSGTETEAGSDGESGKEASAASRG
ncbi:MAG: hypothetical protein LBR53_06740 [Deltaproteobacteria bacterium]|nr:hypothetical protein [Deltaproteobacteria bacterium]